MDVSGSGVKVVSDDILQTPLDQAEIEFEHEGSETYICGNPPYKGTKNQSAEQKADLLFVFSKYPRNFQSARLRERMVRENCGVPLPCKWSSRFRQYKLDLSKGTKFLCCGH